MSKRIKKFFKPEESRLCFLGTFPPRACGIASFTADLSKAIDRSFNPAFKSTIVAIDEDDSVTRNYGSNISTIKEKKLSDYADLAKKINKSDSIGIVSIQHEFGIFGGRYGDYLISFMNLLKKPAVTTFHTVLPAPDHKRKKLVQSIIVRSAAIVVMAKRGKEILVQDYQAEPSKIRVIHHGIPDVPFQPPKKFKRKKKLEGKKVISTFGMISQDKGIEYMIRSLPNLVKKHPALIYLVIGITHPVVKRKEGEVYRDKLVKLVKDLKLEKHVKFFDRYLELSEIIDYLLATDIYICTNIQEHQITSGTLAYAVGCSKAVVSTPIEYAKEIISDQRGMLTEFKDSKSYEKAIDQILSNPEKKEQMEKNAYVFSRSMTWNNVALKYLKLFNELEGVKNGTTEKYPRINLSHLRHLTDDFGILQFSINSNPDTRHGYTLDDNSRALIVAVMHYNLTKSNSSAKLIRKYLDFIEFAQDENRKIVNLVQKKREITEENYSQDSFGRAVWSLGYAMANLKAEALVKKAKEIFNKSSCWLDKVNSVRTKAFLIMGLSYHHKKFRDGTSLKLLRKHADSLVLSYARESSENWKWFEKELTYSNGKIPESLFFAYQTTKDKKYLEVAERSLKFLTDTLIIDGKLTLIGQKEWYRKDGKRSLFDQQPVDAYSMVSVYLTASRVTEKDEYRKKAIIAFNWFLGKNHLKEVMYNEATGGCYDGLKEHSVNPNQGAESTLAYLLARLLLESA